MGDIYAEWPAPANVTALTTVRQQGESIVPYDSFNLAFHVGDAEHQVQKNRASLLQRVKAPENPHWLNQTHSTDCVRVEEDINRNADASVTSKPNTVLAVMTADCQPILLCNKQGNEVAAIHAGWKGLAHGIVENTLSGMKSAPSDLMAWLGPAICASCFEVGDDVRNIYLERYPLTGIYFRKHGVKWLADLPGLSAFILRQSSVSEIYASNLCTYEQKKDFYSYRRDQQTGRMASLIWFNNTQDSLC